jgi:hypothetical protein
VPSVEPQEPYVTIAYELRRVFDHSLASFVIHGKAVDNEGLELIAAAYALASTLASISPDDHTFIRVGNAAMLEYVRVAAVRIPMMREGRVLDSLADFGDHAVFLPDLDATETTAEDPSPTAGLVAGGAGAGD